MSKSKLPMSNKIQNPKSKNLSFSHLKFIGNWKLEIGNLLVDFLIYSFIGLVVGGRLGHVFFYEFSYYSHHPLAIISPFDANGNFVGIYGMSYFGGLIGIIIASIMFVRKRGISFWDWADFVVPAVPAGYFFGRVGNFLNGELYGKETNSFFGMYFGGENILRHPTQLYEAFFEGLILFFVLWFLRNCNFRVCFFQSACCGAITDNSIIDPSKKQIVTNKPSNYRNKTKISGILLLIYLAGYGIIRFFVEFLREGEKVLIFGLTGGQIFSLGMIFFAIFCFLWRKKRE